MSAAPTFQISTIDGQTYAEGDTNGFDLGDPAARLESFKGDGDFIALTYKGGLTVYIPEHRIQYIAELGS